MTRLRGSRTTTQEGEGLAGEARAERPEPPLRGLTAYRGTHLLATQLHRLVTCEECEGAGSGLRAGRQGTGLGMVGGRASCAGVAGRGLASSCSGPSFPKTWPMWLSTGAQRWHQRFHQLFFIPHTGILSLCNTSHNSHCLSCYCKHWDFQALLLSLALDDSTCTEPSGGDFFFFF